ncbi:hypothetical protein D3C81_1303410 [compost metagenome]
MPTAYPLRLWLVFDAGANPLLDLHRGTGRREVALKQLLQTAPGRMGVGIVDARHRHLAVQVNDRGIASAIAHHLIGRTYRDDFSCLDRDGLSPRLPAISGVDLAIAQDQICLFSLCQRCCCMKRSSDGQ